MEQLYNEQIKKVLDIMFSTRLEDKQNAYTILQNECNHANGDAMYLLGILSSNLTPFSTNVLLDDAIQACKEGLQAKSTVGIALASVTPSLIDIVNTMYDEATIQVAFDKVHMFAKKGDIFCQYIVALHIVNKSVYVHAIQDEKEVCITLLYSAFEGGIEAAGSMLLNCVGKEEAQSIISVGASVGYARYKCMYGDIFFEDGIYEEALFWYEQAAVLKYEQAYSKIAKMYEQGLGVIQDDKIASLWYKKISNA